MSDQPVESHLFSLTQAPPDSNLHRLLGTTQFESDLDKIMSRLDPKGHSSLTDNHELLCAAPTISPLVQQSATLPDVSLEVPFYSQLSGGKVVEQCFDTARRMAKDAKAINGKGGGVTVLGSDQRIQIGLSEDKLGQLEISKDRALEGLEYINQELSAGRPVVVGVSWKDADYNKDKLTDHFIVITGRHTLHGTTEFTFLDPGTEIPDKSRGVLTVESDYKMVKKGTPGANKALDARYEVSMVRKHTRDP